MGAFMSLYCSSFSFSLFLSCFFCFFDFSVLDLVITNKSMEV